MRCNAIRGMGSSTALQKRDRNSIHKVIHGAFLCSTSTVTGSVLILFSEKPLYRLSIRLCKATHIICSSKVCEKTAKTLFPGSEDDKNCCSCRKPEQIFSKCYKHIDGTKMVARKATFVEKKKSSKNTRKRILLDMVQGINQHCDIEKSRDDEAVQAYF